MYGKENKIKRHCLCSPRCGSRSNPQHCFTYSFTTWETFLYGREFSWVILHFSLQQNVVYRAHSQICDKRLFASSCLSVRKYVRPSAWNNSAPTGRIFMVWYLSVFRKSVEKVQFSFKSDKNNRYFTWRPIYIFDNISLNSSQNEKCLRQNL